MEDEKLQQRLKEEAIVTSKTGIWAVDLNPSAFGLTLLEMGVGQKLILC